MHRLVRDRPEARLLLAGDMQWPVMREIQRRRLTEIARIVGPTRQMRTLYLAADVTVLPTFYDPSSKVILESLLYGVPAVSTLFNGASQWIYSPTGEHPIPTPFDVEPRGLFHHEHEQPAGRVIGTPTDHASLTQAMAEMCDPGERQRCAEATQQIGDRISMDHHVEKLEVLLREVAADK